MNLETLTTFFGWALVLNIAFYAFTAFALMLFKGLVGRLSRGLFDVDEQTARNESFAYLARYKLTIIAFFLAPYIALRLTA